MKYLFSMMLVILMGSLIISCNEEPSTTATMNDSQLPIAKVNVVEDYFDYNLDWDPPYTNCATGEDMQNHGWIRVFSRAITNPSGNTTISSWVDYNYFDGVTLENLGTGEIWTLTNGHNPFHEVIKENGFYVLSYHWNELYKLDNQTLHILLKGFFKINKDGVVTHARESYTCR